MKDRKGKELQSGDVCVIHYSMETPEPIPESFFGELCEVRHEVYSCAGFHCRLMSEEVTRIIYTAELEIIGDVR